MTNAEALKLPDPLLVRIYREGLIDQVQRVSIEENTRHVTVEIRGQGAKRFLYLQDFGWIPDVAAT